MPVVVLGILLGVSLMMTIPLVAEKVWKCKEEDRIAKQVDRDVKIFYQDIRTHSGSTSKNLRV